MTLAILSALPQEQTGLRALLDQPRLEQHAGREYCLGLWAGRPVVLLGAGGAARAGAGALVEAGA